MRKQGLRNKELERLYGVRNGGDRKSEPNNSEVITTEALASQSGQSRDEWFNAKKLAEAIPDFRTLHLYKKHTKMCRIHISKTALIAYTQMV